MNAICRVLGLSVFLGFLVSVAGEVASEPSPAIVEHTIVLKATPNLTYSYIFGVRPVQGLHSKMGPVNHLVQITSKLETDPFHVAMTVCAHEIGHALGVDHINDLTCWMYQSCDENSPQITWPGKAELEIARRTSTGKVFKLKVDCQANPGIARAARWAAETWNCALGRDVVIVQR